jgi:hypothetical protein
MTVPAESGPWSSGGSKRGGQVASLVFGAAFILFGLLLLVSQLLHIDLAGLLWPFFIIVPGVALFLAGLLASGKAGEPLAIVGSIITMIGSILLFQNVTGLWATWAYAWALIAPTSIGLGLLLWGAIKGHHDKVKEGLNLAGIGLVIFLVAGAFFELVLGVSGFGLGPLALPLMLIGLGVLLVLVNLVRWVRR